MPIASATLGDVLDNANETDADEIGTGMDLIGTCLDENALDRPKNPAASATIMPTEK
jgi:hypothetical protein